MRLDIMNGMILHTGLKGVEVIDDVTLERAATLAMCMEIHAYKAFLGINERGKKGV